uniref:Uncharacterized protein n=1 Tax=Micrurus paraensis TaxID=1970185 RepID=A0A2D4JVI2_9SAUR
MMMMMMMQDILVVYINVWCFFVLLPFSYSCYLKTTKGLTPQKLEPTLGLFWSAEQQCLAASILPLDYFQFMLGNNLTQTGGKRTAGGKKHSIKPIHLHKSQKQTDGPDKPLPTISAMS